MPDLSILIPARNEQFLALTIDDILHHMEGDTEIIAVLDGQWASPPIADHPRVHLVYHSQSIGQRAAVNEAAKMSTAKYIMKLDAHCSLDQGFDVKLMANMQDDWTVVPVMRNLHAFNWRCVHCGMEVYQGPIPERCRNEACDALEPKFEQIIVWIPKESPQSSAYRFNKELRFKYFPELRKHQPQTGMAETMSLQGSCFMVNREKFFELSLCDETWGSWGQQGSEVAIKTWLSGGRVLCNLDTWYAHLFRTQPGFSHPFPDPGKEQQRAIRASQDVFFNNKYEKAIHPLSWLVEKFWFALAEVGDMQARWESQDIEELKNKAPKKGIVYYTDNRLDPNISNAVVRQIDKSVNGHEVISVSLKPLDWRKNIHLDLERGYLTMFRQILAGLEASTADVVFLCEHDVLYHPSHFDFIPPKKDVFYYNENCFKVDARSGKALFYFAKQTSGLCAYRELLVDHYRKRVAKVERDGFARAMGFEPGTHNRKERIDDYKAESWMSEYPNIDIRHSNNLTPSRWRREQFRNQKYTRGWLETATVPGWGKTEGRFDEILAGIND